MLSLLIYGYATGTHSSRKIERATYDSLAFRFIACDQHPDHDTLSRFRRRFGEQFAAIFVQVLQHARGNQRSRFGTVSLDGTRIHANASRHRALSYGHAENLAGDGQQDDVGRWRWYAALLMTTAGRCFCPDWSVNGKATSTMSPKL